MQFFGKIYFPWLPTFLNEIIEKLHQGTDEHLQETSVKNPPFLGAYAGFG